MGIFSAKYRGYSKLAFQCILRKVTLRKCDTGVEEQIRTEMTAIASSVSPSAAGFTFKYYKMILWLLTIITLASGVLMLQGAYNFYQFGNCNGPNSDEFCIFNPTATLQTCTQFEGPRELKTPTSLQGHILSNGTVTVIEYGCLTCPFTKKIEPTVQKLLQKYIGRITFIFKPLPIASHNNSWTTAVATECSDQQGKYSQYRETVFEKQNEIKQRGLAVLIEIAESQELDIEKFEQCLNSTTANNLINETFEEGIKNGIYATPTFFVGNKSFVGNVLESELTNAIEDELQ